MREGMRGASTALLGLFLAGEAPIALGLFLWAADVRAISPNLMTYQGWLTEIEE